MRFGVFDQVESGAGMSSAMNNYESLISTTDVEHLKHAWRNEKAALDILRFEAALVHRCIEDLQQHLEQSILSKFPDRYKSHLKQSIISKEDDVGNVIIPVQDADVLLLILNVSLWMLSGEENLEDLEADNLYAICYKSKRPLVESGDIDLI